MAVFPSHIWFVRGLTASASSTRSFPQRGDSATAATATGATATSTTAGVSGGEVGVSVDDCFFCVGLFGLPFASALSAIVKNMRF
jgi:hypothetical protein